MDAMQEFFAAITEGDLATFRRHLRHDPGIAARRIDGVTPLHVAARAGHRRMVDALLDHGADINALDRESDQRPIDWANEIGHAGMVEHLFTMGALIDFHAAAQFGLGAHVRELCESHPTMVDVVSGFGTPLHHAALWGRGEVVEVLLDCGADPDVANADGHTAYDVACRQVRSAGRDTPLVDKEHRKALLDGCRRAMEILAAVRSGAGRAILPGEGAEG